MLKMLKIFPKEGPLKHHAPPVTEAGRDEPAELSGAKAAGREAWAEGSGGKEAVEKSTKSCLNRIYRIYIYIL